MLSEYYCLKGPILHVIFSLWFHLYELTLYNRVSWIEICGIKYAKENIVILESNLLPLFGIIIDILCINNHFYFVCCTLHTECFSSHFHAYEVSKHSSTNIIFCSHSDLIDHNVLGLYTLQTSPNYFVPVKYHLIENL